MKKLLRVVVAAGCMGLGLLAWAHDEKDMKMPPQKASSAEFQQLKQLVGKWNGMTVHPGPNQKPEPVSVEFKLTAAGSAIQETLMQGTPHEMVDMYHDENGRLAMTHYCAMGNQPHMVLRQAGPHSITFEMGPTEGINPGKDAHMHMLMLAFPDASHLTENWVSYKDGKPGDSVTMNLARVK